MEERTASRHLAARPRALAGGLVLGAAAAFVAAALVGVTEPPAQPRTAADAEPRDSLTAERTVRVEVLNGSGRSGVAWEATLELRRAGFDVVYFGNAQRFDHAVSAVLDRSGDPAAVRAVAQALGIVEVRSEPDAALLLDATVILGSDWAPPPPPPPPGWAERALRLLRREPSEPD